VWPEAEDRARIGGVVVSVEQDERVGLGGELAGAWRAVYRVRIRRTLPLHVGDKLANRHGHKGVVGAILPDDEMPRWGAPPLDEHHAPLRVPTRSTGGQVYGPVAGAVAGEGESIAGLTAGGVLSRAAALGIDRRGRSRIDPPAKGGWLGEAVEAITG